MKGLRLKFRELWLKLIRQDATPHAIGTGFAIGLFATFYPIPFVDTLVALLAAKLVRANAAACVIGNSFILIIFPVIPLLLSAEVFVGRFLTHAPKFSPPGKEPFFTWLMHLTGHNLAAFLLGGVVLGVPTALFSYWGVRKAAAKWQKRSNG